MKLPNEAGGAGMGKETSFKPAPLVVAGLATAPRRATNKVRGAATSPQEFDKVILTGVVTVDDALQNTVIIDPGLWVDSPTGPGAKPTRTPEMAGVSTAKTLMSGVIVVTDTLWRPPVILTRK